MDRFAEEQLPRLLELLYDAALDHSRWQAFLDALRPCFGGATGIMYGFDRASGAMDFTYNFGSDPAFIESYDRYYGRINPYPDLALRLPPGKVAMAADALDTETLCRTEFFNDWMRPQDIPAEYFGMLVHKHGSRGVIMGLAPQAAHFNRNHHIYRRQLELLMPHMARAVEINRVMAAARTAERALGTSFDALRLAAFVVDGAGRLLLANQKAEDLLRDDSVLCTDRSKRLHAANRAENTALEVAIVHALHPPTALTTRPVRLTSRASGRAFIIWAVPMRSEQPNGPSHRSQFMLGLRTEATVLVLVVAAECALSIRPESIQAAFKLSAAEARLVSALIAGRTLAEYARDSGHSRNTVRNQLASIFEKTDTRRQAELVAAIIGTLGMFGSR